MTGFALRLVSVDEVVERQAPADARSVLVTNLKNGVPYTVSVRSLGGSGWQSAWVSAAGTPTLSEAPEVSRLIVSYEPQVPVSEKPGRATGSSQLDLMAIEPGKDLGAGMRTVELSEPVTEATAERLAQELAADPRVRWAEPDQFVRTFDDTLAPSSPNDRQRQDPSTADSSLNSASGGFTPAWTTPNDPYYLNSSMWGLTGTYGVKAPGAWSVTRGSSSVVVAVLDTGITAHPDLDGQSVAGYDMIDDLAVANDGNGRDASPSDPGDWISSAESQSGYFAGCPVSSSSWHGTHVAGTIAAIANNGIGVVGLAPSVKIQNVRVLGKCGGWLSDIAAGITWASGGSVSGVPANNSPARVINMSLGGSESCSDTYQTAINGAVTRGATVVVAAGNENQDASGFRPASCSNVVTVAAIDSTGKRAWFSNYGSVVDVAAPGFGIWSTLNTGSTTPGSSTYASYNGTSMATPHVAGVVALMLSQEPSLTPSTVESRLKNSSRVTAFPGGSCDSVTSKTCGAGIVNAALQFPAGPPGAPTGLVATPGNGQASIAFTAPASNGGSVITNYEYSINNGVNWITRNPVSTTSPLVIPSLVNGTTYQVRLRAVNSAGSGVASAAVSVTPRTVPGAPTGLVATPGNGQASIAFTAPASNGGSVITNYQYSTNNGVGWVTRNPASAASPLVITGLANGTTYQVLLRAANASGVGAASTAVSVTPRTVPGAPTGLVVTAGNGSASIAFTAPASNGGSAITNYLYSINNGANWITRNPASTASPVVITGLVNGTTYQLRLMAVNVAGGGGASSAVSVTPRAVPGTPTGLVATPGNGQASIAFTAPASNDGSAAMNYQYSINDGATWVTRTPVSTASPLLITGLVNGTTYQVRLRAVNSAGAGATSASVSVTPRTVPGAPTGLVVTPGNGQASIAFTAPASNGGSVITNYEYSINNGVNWIIRNPASTTSPLVITGLVNGTTYQVQLRAVNAAGPGGSSAVVPVTPRTVPGAPTTLVATAGNGQASIAFTAPASNGGSAITNYQYSIDNGANWVTRSPVSTTSPLVITGLVNGTTYQVRLRAVNAAGFGAASDPAPLSPGATGAPGGLVFLPGSGTGQVYFTAPTTPGGVTITNYQYSIDNGANWLTRSPGSTAAPLVLPGLVNGTAYQVRIRAVTTGGFGSASAAFTVVASGSPGQPTSIVATPGNGSAVVSFAPVANGGSFVDYQTSTDQGLTWTSRGSTTPLLVTGLTNGTGYLIWVRAVNAAGVVGPTSTPVYVRPG